MKKSIHCAAVLVTAALAVSSARAARILGIDVSSFQGSITWSSVAADGITFAYARATQSTTFQDPDYHANMVHGKAAGLQMGAYEFANPSLDTPAQEANYFWNYAGADIKADGKSISPAIDFEVFSGHVGAPTYTAWFNMWLADVKAKTPAFMRGVIYVAPCNGACDLTTGIGLSAWIVNLNGGIGVSDSPWTTCLSCNAWDPNGTGGWSFWQFSDTGRISGISGDVDLDTYNGSLANLKANLGVGGD